MKKSKIIKFMILIPAFFLFLFVLPGILFIAVSVISGGEDRTFDQQRVEAYKELDVILAAQGLCTTKYACSEDQVSIFWAGNAARFSKGFKVEIYGTSDQKLLGELSQTFTHQFNITPEMEQISIQAYAPTRKQVGNHLLPMRGAILDINMKRTVAR